MTTVPTVTRSVPSPLGALLLVGDGEALSGLYLTNHKRAPSFDGAVVDDAAFPEAVGQLGEWFAGERQVFDVALDPRGTPFQLRVWAVLREIPFGETTTYGAVAARAGVPGSARATGAAIGRNPVSIVVPCHRVVGAAGALTGYAGGLDNKRWLLDHERRILDPAGISGGPAEV